MSLNFKENDQEPEENNRDVGPILHRPAESSGASPKLIVVIALVVILLAGAFVIYKFILHKNKQSPPKIEALTQGHDTTKNNVAQNNIGEQSGVVSSAQSNVQTTTQPTVVEKKTEPDNSAKGNFTIYIARHKTQTVADEEAGRWKDAGYTSAVFLIDGWYCVSVGRFETSDEAKEEAEKLSDGFEAGYKVGIVRE